MIRYQEIAERVRNRSAQIYVIGLGYIGLPTALFYASKGFSVVGIDTNQEMIEDLHKGIVRMYEEGINELASRYLELIKLESSYDAIGEGDVFVLCLPSPIDADRKPILKPLESSVSCIAKQLNKGALILVESTIPAGTTGHLAHMFEQLSGFKIDQDVWFAHCPERVLPGKVIAELETNYRLAGGITPDSTELATIFLSEVFGSDHIRPTNAKISEVVKLAENAFRDVNIAYANELAKICTVLKIDVNEVIKLANLHPRVSILNPGMGVGGYCLPKDGWLLINSIEQTALKAEVIPASRSVNDSMPLHVLASINRVDIAPHERNVGVLGLSFKSNVADTRNSPSINLIQLLMSEGWKVTAYDPLVDSGISNSTVDTLDEVVNICQVIVVCVGHDILIEQISTKDLSQKIIVDPGNAVPQLKNQVRMYIGISESIPEGGSVRKPG